MKFDTYLKRCNLAPSTIQNYQYTVKLFHRRYKDITKENLLDYKDFLINTYQPNTVNVRILGMNKYLGYLGKEKLKLKTVKVQQKNFLENVISSADYIYFKKRLKKLDDKKLYFAVWFMAATGARISELVKFKIENIHMGYIDLYTKHGKLRRIYIPNKLQKEALAWVEKQKRTTGFVFLNRFGKQITTRGLAQQIKRYSRKYNLDSKTVYPHSFRHRYAKNFLEKHNDVALLADLMGHERIETTRIYLRKTASEQHEIVNKIVTW